MYKGTMYNVQNEQAGIARLLLLRAVRVVRCFSQRGPLRKYSRVLPDIYSTAGIYAIFVVPLQAITDEIYKNK